MIWVTPFKVVSILLEVGGQLSVRPWIAPFKVVFVLLKVVDTRI